MRNLYAISIIAVLLAPVLAAVHMVTIKNFSFQPQEVDIKPGDQVTWTNIDIIDHTVVSNDGTSFASSNLATGQSFSFTFKTAATLPYHCSIHPFMLGTVKAATLGIFILVISTQTVQAAPLPDPTKIENSLPKGSLMPCPKSWNPRAGHGPACQRAA
ncbi:hypothetical protein CPC16_001614 [Podila verticillata]|nr:hypothetical protein CPC16_001614 [Podila verticillata]